MFLLSSFLALMSFGAEAGVLGQNYWKFHGALADFIRTGASQGYSALEIVQFASGKIIDTPEVFIDKCLGKDVKFGSAVGNAEFMKRYEQECAGKSQRWAAAVAGGCDALVALPKYIGLAPVLACDIVMTWSFAYQQAFAVAWLYGHALDDPLVQQAVLRLVAGGEDR